MEEYEFSPVNIFKMNKPFETQQELLDEAFALLDYLIFIYYSHHKWLGPENDMKNMLGLVVTREEFENNLSGGNISLADVATADEYQTIKMSIDAFNSRLKRTVLGNFPIKDIYDRFELNTMQWFSFLLCYATKIDERYEKLCAYLQDDITKKYPTAMLCINLFKEKGIRPESFLSSFDPATVFGSLFDKTVQENQLSLKPEVIDYISGNKPLTQSGIYLFSNNPIEDMKTHFETAKVLDKVIDSSEKKAVLLSGPSGCGKCFQIKHLCKRHKRICVFADMKILEYKGENIQKASFLARLYGADLCLYHLDTIDNEGNITDAPPGLIDAIRNINLYSDNLYLLSTRSIHPEVGLISVDVEMESATENQRAELFASCFFNVKTDKDVDAYELASKFSFEPKQIVGACNQAIGMAALNGGVVDSALIHKCCYRQVMTKLSTLASKVKPNFTWDDVVMPEQQKKLLQHACNFVKYKHKVYQNWGFDNRISYGRGLSILLAGVPGTGKTMSAQVMANQLNMEMYKINISQIVSKYIGETEKNLQAVFNEAKKANCILFFDECDALFGKRSEVKDAHDRNANVEVAYLLQQIEEHEGVCILATNLLQNIDEAFMRRITYVVRFPFPDAKARKEIYLRTIPDKTPIEDDIDWDFIAEKFALSGGHIKNIVLSAAFAAAAEDTSISMKHMLNAAVGEMKKNDIVVVREELQEYADLLNI